MNIKELYYDLIKKYHPDLGGDPEIFKKIKETYENNNYDDLLKYKNTNLAVINNLDGTETVFEIFRCKERLGSILRFAKQTKDGKIYTPEIKWIEKPNDYKSIPDFNCLLIEDGVAEALLNRYK